MLLDKRYTFPEGPGKNGIQFGNSTIEIGRFNCKRIMQIESPVILANGYYDIGKLGAFTYISEGARFRYIESIGRFCQIGMNVTIGLPEHDIKNLTTHAMFDIGSKIFNGYYNYSSTEPNYSKIKQNMKNNRNRRKDKFVVVGNEVIILRGVTIGDGAVIGAGTVVTKDVPPYAVVSGNPAKIIKYRFSDNIINELLTLKWWEYGPDILKDIDISNLNSSINELKKRISFANKMDCTLYECDPSSNEIRKINGTDTELMYRIP